MGNESNKWNQIMVAAMAVPGIKVNRASFLQHYKFVYTRKSC